MDIAEDIQRRGNASMTTLLIWNSACASRRLSLQRRPSLQLLSRNATCASQRSPRRPSRVSSCPQQSRQQRNLRRTIESAIRGERPGGAIDPN